MHYMSFKCYSMKVWYKQGVIYYKHFNFEHKRYVTTAYTEAAHIHTTCHRNNRKRTYGRIHA